MHSKLIHENEGRRTFAVVFDIGDEVMEGLQSFASENRLRGSELTAIGAFQDVTLAFWDWETREYQRNPIRQQVEVAALVGNIAVAPDGTSPKVHAHAVVGLPDGMARAGHLLEAHVRPTLEVVVTESAEHLQRQRDERTGLALIRPDPDGEVR